MSKHSCSGSAACSTRRTVSARDVDAGHVVGDEAHAADAAQDADRGDEREPLGEADVVGGAHEPLEQLGPVADLQLQVARAGQRLLGGAAHAELQRRRGRVLDRADAEVRPGASDRRRARQVVAAVERPRQRDELDAVEVEDAPGLGLVAGADVVAGEAGDVLDAVHRGAHQVGLAAPAGCGRGRRAA